MTTKTKTVDWGGLTLDVNTLRTGASGPGSVGTAINATAAEINLACDISARGPVAIGDATTYTVLAANSGLVHVFPDFTSSCTATLPVGTAGLTFEFMYGGVATDAQNFLVVPQSGTYFTGGVVFCDSGADATTSVYGDGAADDTFTIVTPEAGTHFKVVSDGTTWYITGTVVSATVCTIA